MALPPAAHYSAAYAPIAEKSGMNLRSKTNGGEGKERAVKLRTRGRCKGIGWLQEDIRVGTGLAQRKPPCQEARIPSDGLLQRTVGVEAVHDHEVSRAAHLSLSLR